MYEPILRVLTARGYKVTCEYECPGIAQPKKGDKKRLDFYAVGTESKIAIEVKWAKSEKINVSRDIEKLKALLVTEPNTFPLLCVFGRRSHLDMLKMKKLHFVEWGRPVYADMRKTIYGCRIYRFIGDNT